MTTTTLQDQISAAIGAHGLWKRRLRQAIDTGKTDMSVEVVKNDQQCAFGKWLYGPELPAAEKSSAHYKKCADLHRRFHASAAAVMSLALAGKKQEARDALEDNHDFAKISSELTRALTTWKEV